MDFDNILALIITTVLVPLLTWGVSVLINFGNAKIKQVKDATLQAALDSSLHEMENAVLLAVTETQETFVKALKEEGKFDDKAAQMAFNLSFKRAKEIMSNAGFKILETATNAANEIITAQIESALKEVKEVVTFEIKNVCPA